MNIFYLHPDPQKCAEMHNDKHTVKMVLEYCQLLSTAHRVLDGRETVELSKTGRKVKRWKLDNEFDDVYYSATHVSHPSAVWCRMSSMNYDWLVHLLIELCKEYTYRYGKIHKCQATGLVEALRIHPRNIPDAAFTEPTPAMPDDVKIAGSSIRSYRNYYIKNKTHLANWKNRNIPEWYNAHL